MKKIEQLSPDRKLLRALNNRTAELSETEREIRQALNPAPNGRLYIHHGKYFQIRPGVKARYLKKSEDTLIRALAQKTYNKALLCRIRTERILLEKLIALLEKRPVSALWTRYTKTRQKLIRPATLSDDAYAKEWSTVHYKKLGFKEDEPVLLSAGGIRMRSKSELLIAALLEKCGIPYRYEYPLEIADQSGSKKQFRPDFYCLEPETRREFVWEHFGLMDDTAYRVRAEDKMETFFFSDAFNERNFIVTFEEKDHPLNIAEVASKLTYFLDTIKK
ncbi:MAG: hypothetical protein KBT02_06555 [Treponema sp.]|nr:hypothetical protein [Candidatus Treponema caballi]